MGRLTLIVRLAVRTSATAEARRPGAAASVTGLAVAVAWGTVAALAALIAVPAKAGARRPPAEILQAESS
jgi:hypothetical protein